MARVTLKDICDRITDGSHNPPTGLSYSEYLMISSKNIDDDCISLENPRYLSKEDFENENRRSNIQPNDLLMTIVGTIGRVAVVQQGMANLCLQRSVGVLKLKLDIINPRFLMYQIQNMRPLLEKAAHGVAQKGIYLKQVEQLPILVPKMEEQQYIVTVLDKISDLISLRKQQLAKLDELVKARFVEMFGDINVNDKEWPIQPLGELCEISRGGSPRPIEQFLGGTVPWIKIGDATNGDDIFLNTTKEFIIEEGVKKSRLVSNGSLIFANCGVSLGFARIITFSGCIHDGWLAFENIDNRLDKVFLLNSLNQMTKHFRAIAPAGTQPNLNTAIMKEHKQIIPPLLLQEKFTFFVEQVSSQKLTIQQSLDKLEVLKKSLMQEYFG